ncbi:protein FANTASTIC FOUR 3-like [Phalaenopsis equestris]|uniref:protein FANTASTIC FOUR 3-like n=1 Tax=Phalaenopsis equestris TaxID=78828 RepID=UPI0009E5F292|nr:protein FANTASTIC FOUR 3-like [Phalaenopsis equestris]
METMPSLSSDKSRENFHGLNSTNFGNNTMLDASPPLPLTHSKQWLTTNSNLDMCTETLGCETGAMCSVLELEMASVKKKKKKNEKNLSPKSALPPEFPPPLTTLRGKGRLRLGRKREEGRLLLIPFKTFAVESERSGGRLLLRILPAKEGREGEEEDEVEEKGVFSNGGGGKYGISGRCKEGKKMGAAAIFNCDSVWVASS